jgi:TatA/E family protein of Tat protein translocase
MNLQTKWRGRLVRESLWAGRPHHFVKKAYNKPYMGPIGIQELVLILVIALLVFGPKKLPELGRSIGKTLAEFRRASNEIKHNIEKEMEDPEAK